MAGDALHKPLPLPGPATFAVELGPVDPDFSSPGQSSWISGVFHLITVMIGAGVLSLPSSFAALGWALGPALLAAFGAATVWSSCMLVQCLQTPDGRRHPTYKDAVTHIMGGWHPTTLASILYLNMSLSAVGYTLAGMTSLQFIASTSCTLAQRSQAAPCPMASPSRALLLFAALQALLNLLPSLDSIWWVSALGAAMSLLYSTLALALACAHISTHGPAASTSLLGPPGPTPFLKAATILSALGNVAFSWSSGLMLPSIQATLREPPKSSISMRKAIAVSYSSTGAFYLAVACLGYGALGAGAPGDVLTGFDVAQQLALMANAAVLLHMVAAVQVYMQPLFKTLEAALPPHSPLTPPGLQPAPSSRALLGRRFVYRLLCTAAVSAVAYCLPHFSLVSGLNGALTFWPLQIGYPFAMFTRTYPPPAAMRRLMHVTSASILCACVLATLGSFHALATTSSS